CVVGGFACMSRACFICAFAPARRMHTDGALLSASAAGSGSGVIFELVPYYVQEHAGTANGIVSMMGGLGGFLPPLLLSAIFSITGSYSIGFMAFSQFALVSLLLVLWMYYMDRINLSQDVFNSANQGIMVT